MIPSPGRCDCSREESWNVGHCSCEGDASSQGVEGNGSNLDIGLISVKMVFLYIGVGPEVYSVILRQ